MVKKTYFKTKDYCKVKFSVEPENAETVGVYGLNGDWENAVILKKKKDGSFSGEVNLPKNSTHEFKYRVNESEWLDEPQADEHKPNEYGGTNNVIHV